MRKFSDIIMTLLLPMALLLTGCEEETVLKESDFPQEIKSWVGSYFPDHEIIQVVKDRDDFKVGWEAFLSDGVALEFDKNYHITDLFYAVGLPDAVIPEAIVEYVHTNYPQQFIVKWELDKKNQEVGLDNGLELYFSTKGDFLRIDAD